MDVGWGGRGGRVGVSWANTHERVVFPGIGTVLFLPSVAKEWKMTGGCCDCIVYSPTPWGRGGGGLERGRGDYFPCDEVVHDDYGRFGVHSNTVYVAMRGCGQERLVEATGGLKALMHLHPVR